MKKRILYGVANYAEMVRDNGYFVDKTEYIAKLEWVKNPVFLRPRRFGKSLLCSLLRHYYDLNEADNFAKLFGQTWIGQHPTGRQNQNIILYLNFSTIATGPTVQEIDNSCRRQCNTNLSYLHAVYPALLADMPTLEMDTPVADHLDILLTHLWQRRLPPLYVIIDEYDNFANQLITENKDELYRQLTADDGFFKTFFKP